MEENKVKNSVLIFGTGHEYQRHQDKVEAFKEARTKFEQRIRETVSERKIELIAEEAGDDKSVWAALKERQKRDFEMLGPLIEGTEIVDHPVQTIAKTVADESRLPHVDIRPPRANEMKVSERDAAMCEKILESFGSASRVLAIVGGDHQKGIAKLLSEAGFNVAVESFPESSKHDEVEAVVS